MQKKKILLDQYFFNLKLVEGSYAGAKKYDWRFRLLSQPN